MSIVGEHYQLSQVLNVTKDLPYGINKEYIENIKPSGLLRTWFQSKQQNGNIRDVQHQVTMTMELLDTQSSTSQEFGKTSMNIKEGDKVASHATWDGHEIAFAFSKADSAESKLTQTGDSIR